MLTGRALQQILRSWHSAGLGYLQRVAACELEVATSATMTLAAPAMETQAAAPDSPPIPHADDSNPMARKSSSAAAARVELPVLTVAPEIALKGSREVRLAALAARVAQCTRCQELATTRQKTVFGIGNPNARVMFIGEAMPDSERTIVELGGVARLGRLPRLETLGPRELAAAFEQNFRAEDFEAAYRT